MNGSSGPSGTEKLKDKENKPHAQDKEQDSGNYRKRMAKLNASLAAFMERHPKGDWSEALGDYIKYANDLSKRFPDEGEDDEGTKPKAAPVANVNSSSTFGVAFSSSSSSVVSEAQSAPTKPAEPLEASTAFSTPAAPSLDPPFAAKMDFSGKVPTDQPLFQAPKSVNPFASLAPNAAGGAPSASSNPFASNPFGGSASSSGFGATAGAFSFGAAPGPAPGPALTSGTAATTGDDEGEPELEPEKIYKNEADKTIAVEHERPCKLMRFDDDNKEWLDMGKGTITIVKDTDTNKKRIIVRNPMGKMLLNSYFYGTQSFTLTKNKGGAANGVMFISMVEVVVDKEKDLKEMMPRKFIIKLKVEDCVKTHELLVAGAAGAK